MNPKKNKNFYIGFTLIMLASGLTFVEDSFEGGIVDSSISGVLALIGFIIMMIGFYKSN